MSEEVTTETPEAADQGQATPDPTPEATPEATTDPRPGAEAAKYRRQLRETEAERDGLRAGLEAARRATVEAVLSTDLEIAPASRFAGPLRVRLADPADLAAVGGVEITELFTEEGALDSERLTAEVAQLYETRPGLFAPRLPRADYTQGGGGQTEDPHAWEAAFQPKF